LLKIKLTSQSEQEQKETHLKANIFGILILQERADFYKNKVPKMGAMINRSVEDIISHFN